MPRIESVTVHGFRSIRAIDDLKLGPINVLIGANGSGKSNFLALLEFVQEIAIDDPTERVRRLKEYSQRSGGAEKILHFGSKATSHINAEIGIAGGGQLDFNLWASADDSLKLFGEGYQIGFSSSDSQGLDALNESINQVRAAEQRNDFDAARRISQQYDQRILSGLRSQVALWRRYHFHDTSESAPLRKTADLHDNRFLRSNGANLAAFLYLLREKHESSYRAIRDVVRLAAPFFSDFVLQPLELNPETIRLEWRHVQSDAYFDAASLSDGTLRFIALATALLQPLDLRPPVILIDEPELGLHPYAVTLFAALVRQAAVETQIVVATQSPTLLDHFEPEEVLVADLVDGATQLRRLDAAPLTTWLEEYSLGQLWEKNEFGGRPHAGTTR